MSAFKLRVQLSHEYRDKVATADGKFKKQLVSRTFGMWQQYAQHSKEQQLKVATAVAAVQARQLRSVFDAWHEAASVLKQQKVKVRQRQASGR